MAASSKHCKSLCCYYYAASTMYLVTNWLILTVVYSILHYINLFCLLHQ